MLLNIDNNLVISVVSTILSAYVQNFLESIFVNIIKPFINFDINNDGIQDIHNLEEYHINVNNKKIYIGKVILSLLQLILIMYSLQFLKKYFFKN